MLENVSVAAYRTPEKLRQPGFLGVEHRGVRRKERGEFFSSEFRSS